VSAEYSTECQNSGREVGRKDTRISADFVTLGDLKIQMGRKITGQYIEGHITGNGIAENWTRGHLRYCPANSKRGQ
jgi:hypothetical protein